MLAALAAAGCGVINEPVAEEELRRNVLFTSYSETPKHLDSTASYSSNETPWTYTVYEPPLRYHYLKRPYELAPRTLVELPKTRYVDKSGNELPADAPAADIAQSLVEMKVKPGILYQPHPAFAKDAKGQWLYHALTGKDLEGKTRPSDFPQTGTRELTAEDYAYAIRRLATPRVQSPAYGFLSGYIAGMKEYGERIRKVNEAMKAGLWDEAREHLEAYLARHDDEGNGWGRLAECLERAGRAGEARAALEKGIAASYRHGHPGMAAELEEKLEALG